MNTTPYFFLLLAKNWSDVIWWLHLPAGSTPSLSLAAIRSKFSWGRLTPISRYDVYPNFAMIWFMISDLRILELVLEVFQVFLVHSLHYLPGFLVVIVPVVGPLYSAA